MQPQSLTGVVPEFQTLLERSGLAPMALAGRVLLPIVQGGMGIGVSAHKLAGDVAALGGVGTISAVDLRRHHPDLMACTQRSGRSQRLRRRHPSHDRSANREALRRELQAARPSQGQGLIAVNVMRAVSDYVAYMKMSLEAGADMVVVGAGLPLDLPDLAADYPRALLIPILSDARGVQLVVRKWERKKRMPDAIVIEHPRLAGGHLGAARIADLDDPRFDFERCCRRRASPGAAGIEREMPLIAAGGIRRCEDIRRLQALGAAGVQLGHAVRGDDRVRRHPEFKRVLARRATTTWSSSPASPGCRRAPWPRRG